VWEGPFGDHTGFYSLADWYPEFHVTCITHSNDAIYPATIVGIPPQEDAWIAKATERLFLSPVRLTIQPEIEDFHMPDAGIAHNLVIVKINKSYPGQGMKVINSLSGAGQMMFTKYMIVVSGDIDIRDYKSLLLHVFENTDFTKDMSFTYGPLDVLDHSSDNFSFGGKAGVDATIKLPEENSGRSNISNSDNCGISSLKFNFLECDIIKSYNLDLLIANIPIIILSVDCSKDTDVIEKVKDLFRTKEAKGICRLILVVDYTVDVTDLFMVAWQILGNTDPRRDHEFISPLSVLIDGTIKAYRKGGFPRKWPNVVSSGLETISTVDQKWSSLGIGTFINSPSNRYIRLGRKGNDEILMD
jgi:4-hydroxy-3-polyprenylbenzoate decarboxylase